MNKTYIIICLLLSSLLLSQRKGKDYSQILKSNNIFEINAFLRDAHPDDPKRSVLRPKVMDMMKQYISEAKPEDPKLKKIQEMYAILRSGKSSTKISFGEMSASIRDKQIKKLKDQLEGKIDLKPVDRTKNTYASNTASANPKGSSGVKSINTTSSKQGLSAAEEEEFNMLMGESPETRKQKTVQILNQLFDNDPSTKDTAVFIENKSDCNIIVRIEGAGNTKYRLAVPAKGENTLVILKGDYIFTSNVCGAQYASQKTVQKALMVSLNNPK